jgi:hypothetical protein
MARIWHLCVSTSRRAAAAGQQGRLHSISQLQRAESRERLREPRARERLELETSAGRAGAGSRLVSRRSTQHHSSFAHCKNSTQRAAPTLCSHIIQPSQPTAHDISYIIVHRTARLRRHALALLVLAASAYRRIDVDEDAPLISRLAAALRRHPAHLPPTPTRLRGYLLIRGRHTAIEAD